MCIPFMIVSLSLSKFSWIPERSYGIYILSVLLEVLIAYGMLFFWLISEECNARTVCHCLIKF